MPLLSQTQTLREYCASVPSLSRFALTCAEKGAKVFLTGGTVRDLLLGHPPGSDIDLILEGEKPLAESLRQEFLSSAPPGTHFDIKVIRNASLYVQQFDFTANTLLYDIAADSLTCPTTGLEDLAAKRLQPSTLATFVTGPTSFIRAFRLSHERGLSLSPELLSSIKRFGGLIHLGTPEDHARIALEVFRLFSNESSSKTLSALFQSQLLLYILPALLVLSETRTSDTTRSLLERNQLVAIETENAFHVLGKNQQHFLKKELPLHRSGSSHRKSLGLNALGISRLAALFIDLGSALQNLAPSLPAHLSTSEYASHAMSALIKATASPLSFEPAVATVFTECGKIAHAVTRILSEQLDSASAITLTLKKLEEPHAIAAAGLLLLSANRTLPSKQSTLLERHAQMLQGLIPTN